MVEKQDIDHGELIDDHKLVRQWILLVALIGVVMRCVFQEAMQRPGLGPGGLGETFRCASRWCCQGNFYVALAQQHQQSTDGCCFACAWTTRQDAYFLTVSCMY